MIWLPHIDLGFFDLRNPSFFVAPQILDTVAKWTHYRALNSPALDPCVIRFAKNSHLDWRSVKHITLNGLQ